jgi:predicted hydrocarbon binding protein
MHGLFFFFIKKFAETRAATVSEDASLQVRELIRRSATFLPDGSCPDSDAIGLLQAVSDATGEPLEQTHATFGEYVAPHLIRVARPLIDPSWRTLDVVAHADAMIRAMVHDQQDYAEPPTHETVRISETELHLVYMSQRKMCAVATGIMRGLAAHFRETIQIEESACMCRGSPFCSFVIRRLGSDSQPWIDLANETITAPKADLRESGDPGLADVPPEDDDIPMQVGPYPVVGTIASGAMGRVYLARDQQLGRPVAIKVMRASFARNADARRRFLREGRAAAAISHPHVITVYGVGEHDGRPYLAMQHLQGIPLSACRRPVPVAEALRIGRQIASGLAAAHTRGLIHRDIKPQNIILEDPGNHVRIIDFGLARGTDELSPKVTADGVIVGTPAYISPERLGNSPLDARTDIFGLGVLLYELISGRLPYEGDSMLSMLASIARGSPTPLADVAAKVPQEVCRIVMRLMAHRPEDRPSDARLVEAELTSLEQRLAGEGPQPRWSISTP